MQKLTFIHLDIIFNYPVFIVYPVVFALTVPKKKSRKKKGESQTPHQELVRFNAPWLPAHLARSSCCG
jgi:hypothetical protein